jgi:hypothetical protein
MGARVGTGLLLGAIRKPIAYCPNLGLVVVAGSGIRLEYVIINRVIEVEPCLLVSGNVKPLDHFQDFVAWKPIIGKIRQQPHQAVRPKKIRES